MNVRGAAPIAEETSADAARLALLGHDLRAAVSDIIGGLRLIDQTQLDEPTRLQLERIRSSGEVLARLIEEGLSVMLGDAGAELAHPENVQITRLLYDLEMRWSGRAREKRLAFRVTTSPDIPRVIAVDRLALERVLANLLSNAVKYTDTGAVELGVESGADGSLRFIVTDNGPGFSPAALDRLFQFAGRPEGTRKPGDGLGMRISKDMTGRLGGSITVENLPEGGAEVTLELPTSAWSPVAERGPVELPDLSNVKVLVAEDSPTNQLLVGQILTRMGAEFQIVDDGVEALQRLEREEFDVAIVDIEMPRLSGIEVIRSVRSNDRLHASMPLLAMTAYTRRAEREAIYAAGADSILSKPLPPTEAVGLAIAAAIERKAAAAPSIEECDDAPDLDRAQFDHLIEIAGPESRHELMERLCGDLGRCESGLANALRAGDRASIRAETHVLIALAGAVGATRLQKLAEALNLSAHRPEDAGRRTLGESCMAQVEGLIAFVTAERARMTSA